MPLLKDYIIQESVSNLAALKAIDISLVNNGVVINVVLASGVCQPGWFMYNSSSTATPDDIKIVQPTTGSGRWIRIEQAENISVLDTGTYFLSNYVEGVLQEIGASIAAESLWNRVIPSLPAVPYLLPQTSTDEIGCSTSRIQKIYSLLVDTSNLTIGTLSGILKASSGIISGSAVTDDLPESVTPIPTNLWFTNSRSIASTLTGYTATSGTPSASSTILGAIQNLGYDQHVAVTLGANHGLGLSGQQLVMGTPSTCTAATTNSVSTTTHTHAITGFTPSGTDIPLATVTTLGDLIYGTANAAVTRLAGNTTTTRKFLLSLGSAGAALAPTYDTVTLADVGISSSTPLSPVNGGTGVSNLVGNTITLGGAFAMSGAFGFTGTLINTTAITFPTSGTLATTTTNWTRTEGTPNYLLPTTVADDIGATGARITKGWYTNLEITNPYSLNGTAQQDISTTSTPTFSQVTVDNLVLNSNTLSSTIGAINLTPITGSATVIDSHWSFDGIELTALTNNNTTITAYTGKNITIESVTFDGGVVTGVSNLGIGTNSFAVGTSNTLHVKAGVNPTVAVAGGFLMFSSAAGNPWFLTATGTIVALNQNVSDIAEPTFAKLTIDNLVLDANTLSSTTGNVNLTPVAGSAVVLDGHWSFDANALTALTDNNTTITAYAGKNITIESVTFDGGVIGSVSTINGLTLTAVAVGFTVAGGTTSKTLTVDETSNLSGYANLAGRVGGQIIIGGTASGNNITFQTTSDITKGKYVFSELALANGIVQIDTSGYLSSSITLPNGTLCTTQAASDNSTKLATTAYVDSAVGTENLWDRVAGTPNYVLPHTAGDDIGATGARITKGWYTNLEITNPYSLNGTAQQDISTTSTPTFSQVTVDNLVLNSNTLSSTTGNVNLTPVAGSAVVLDGHWSFDANALTALTDNNTTITAYAGKNITIESVIFDGGVVTDIINLGIGTNVFTAGDTNTIHVVAGTNPTVAIAGGFLMFSSAAGNPWFITGAGTIIALNQNVSTVSEPTFAKLTVDNLRLDLNTLSSTTGALNLTPVAGSAVVLDGHWSFDANALTALTDNNTTLTAYTGKNITIESVTFDGGVVGSITTLSMSSTLTNSSLNTANGIVQTDGSGVFSTSTNIPTATTIGTKYIYRAEGTDIPLADGGTNASLTAALGSVPYTDATAFVLLAGNTTTTRKFLRQTGDGAGNSAAPAWDTVTLADVGISSSTPLALTNGGTAANLTAVQGGIVYCGASAFAISAAGSAGQILRSAGTGIPVWSTPTYPNTANTGKLLVGNGTNWIESTPTFPNAAPSAGKIMIGDGTNWIASTPTYPNASATAGKIIRSDGTNFAASTSTFADTYDVSTLLYASSANIVSGLATGNSGVLVTSGTGVPSISTTIPNGVIATTQSASDNSTKLATTAYVDSAVGIENLWDRVAGTPNYVLPHTAVDDVGATGARITKGWYTNLEITNPYSLNGTAQQDISTTSTPTFAQVTVDNLVLNSNTLSSTTGAINLTPVAGSAVVLDNHWSFDGTTLTAITDNNTTLTAYAGKNITIESVTFDGGVIGSVSTINGLTLTAVAVGFTIAGGTSSKTLTMSENCTINQNLSTTGTVQHYNLGCGTGVQIGAIHSWTINNGGGSYVVGDVITVIVGTRGIFRVSAVTGGVVTALQAISLGYNYTIATYGTTGGTGTGLIIDVTALKDVALTCNSVSYISLLRGHGASSTNDIELYTPGVADMQVYLGNAGGSYRLHTYYLSNALVIGANGNTTLNGTLTITPDADVSPGGGGSLIIGSAAGNSIRIDANEIMASSGASSSTLYLNAEGGVVSIGNGNGNFSVGGSSVGTSGNKVMSVFTGTAPSTSPADAFQMYSSDFAAGNAVPTFRTENGTVCQINQSLTTTSNTVFNSVKDKSGYLTPTGSILPYGGSAAPDGFLLCNGAAISRTTYADLFAVFGTTYGIGDGSTTFNIPNIKGCVIVGLDAAQTEFDALGETGGAKTDTLDATKIPAHNHSASDGDGHSHTVDKWRDDGWVFGGVAASGNTGVTEGNVNTSTEHVSISIGNTGGGLAHNNLQPYIVLNYIVKY